jgi:hypothetical protein
MASYCDISALEKDATNHKDFTNRLNKWKSGNNSMDGCTIGTGNCLTDSELACYSSYQLGISRKKLDASLSNIYQPETSPTTIFDSNYQTTMLTGVFWAALGTTVLYYAFTKI